MKSKKRFFYPIYSVVKRICCLLLLVVCCGSFLGGGLVFATSDTGGNGTVTGDAAGQTDTSNAQEFWPQGPAIQGEAAIVMDAASGTVLYEKNSHRQLYR